MPSDWNHNTHYHRFLVAALPIPCHRALDIGCGQGLLTSQLAPHCTRITGIDFDAATLVTAKPQPANVELLHGDAMTYPFPEASFDFIVSVATLHHLPLKAALTRFVHLLKPGGVLAIIGLYRLQTPQDFLAAAIAKPISVLLRQQRGFAHVGAPVHPPQETLAQIREAAGAHLPGAALQRRLFFRYSLLWKKP